ncbi:D-alanyl-D-alanine carboxypeptidase [Streptomyces sp. NPDC102441]|uniref:D-alanyl-D-alanine carboxypeptidase n=1 Tax=Streptomyces sp. NPDC102441 TaxID=3366176 RepID=UPI0037F3EA39
MSPRLIKEVSVAGESPDRSEQRKSSGTASGTAEERDPRLAVFREPVAAAGGSTAGGTTGSATDSETAVFRLPRSAESGASEDAPAPQEGSEGASGPRAVSEGSRETEGAAGESRTAPADTASSSSRGVTVPDPDADAEGGAEEAGPEAEAEADPDAEAEAEPEPASGDEPGPASGDERAETPEAAPEAPAAIDVDAGTDVDAETDGRPEAGSEPPSDDGPAPTDARLRAAVAAWVTTGPDEETADQSGAVEGDDKPSRSAEDTTDGVGDSPDPADGKAPAADETPGDGETPGDAERDADGSDTDSGADAPAAEAAKAAKAAKDAKDARTSEDAKTSKSADADAESEADAPEAAGDAAAAGPSDGAPRVPKSREEASTAEEAEPAPDGRGIDHPTAVFKAPRAGQIDRPTTALKLPPKEKEAARKPATWAAKPSEAPGPSAASGTPEAPAERTSTFVPLRSDDVRPAPVVGPTVTPDVAAGPGTPASPGEGLAEAERTRQQPMPPRPPLDLLAELTNTPPPAETPVRTAVRRVKIWTPLLGLVLIIFAIAQAVRPLPDPTLTLSVDPTYTFGGEKLDMPWPEDGQGAVEVEGVGTIGTYGKEKSAPIASVAKIMTAYVILQGHPITGKEAGDQIVVDAKAGEEADRLDESTAPIKEGQKYTERQMLQLLMIPSGNNVARLLARWDATTEKAFVEKMNAAAKDLGMTNSDYTDPSGLEPATRSTPADQLKLAKAVLRNDVFREIVNMPQAQIPGIDKMIYNNNNILLEPGVSGIKTGSSTPAGGNLIWTADTVIDGKTRRIVGAVMGADADGILDAKLQRALQSSLALIQTAQDGVDSTTVVKKGQVVGYVDNGFGSRTPVVATKDLKAVGWGGLEVELKLTDGGKVPAQTAKPGTVVGEVTVGTGTGKVSAPVALQSEMTEPGFGDKLTRIT